MDILHKALKWLDYNRYTVAGLLIACATAGWLIGCQVGTESLTTPGRKVTASELERERVTLVASLTARQSALATEAEAVAAKAELARADIAEQQATRAKVIEVLGGIGTMVAEGGTSPAGIIGAVVQVAGLAGLGAVWADKNRKNTLLEAEKAKTNDQPTTK